MTKHSSDRRALPLTGDDACARRATRVRKSGQILKLILFAGLLLLGWSALFAYTYRSPSISTIIILFVTIHGMS